MQPRVGDLQMQFVGFPACRTAQHLGRQRVAGPQAGDEVQRLRDQFEHAAIVGIVGNAELVLQRAQRDGGLAITQHHHHDRRVVSLGVSEQGVGKRGEECVVKVAMIGCGKGL